MIQPSRVFADYNGSHPLLPEVLRETAEQLSTVDGNPSSIHHEGRTAKVALEKARQDIASYLNTDDQCLIFTSGATESNNMVIQGLAEHLIQQADEVPEFVTSTVEHLAVLETLEVLASRNRVVLKPVSVNEHGSLQNFAEVLQPSTKGVFLIHTNNETGQVLPIAELIKESRALSPNAHIHVDAVQSLTKLPMDWLEEADSVAFSGHKIGAFKGIGLLYLRRGCQLGKFLCGGGQERSRRPGTENLPGILSFRSAIKQWKKRGYLDVREQVSQFLEALQQIPGVVYHGDFAKSVGNTVNFHMEGVTGDDLLLNLDLSGVSASNGSACSSGVARPSHVLKAMGYSEWVALNSVRLSFGEGSQPASYDRILEVLKEVRMRLPLRAD